MSQSAIDRACWCGASSARSLGRWPEWKSQLVVCEGCGVRALEPPPTDAELAAAYAEEYYGASRRKFIGPIAALVGWFQGGRARWMARQVPRGGRILDIGCGNGGFLEQMQRRGYRVEGTERTAASAARVPPSIPVHVGDLLDLSLEPHAYDAVTLFHVFEHLAHPHETLQKIQGLLRPGGTLCLSLPNAESAQARRYGLAWFHHDPPRHLFGFGPQSLTRLLTTTGFRVERISTWSWEQNPYGDIQSGLNAAGFPRDRLYRQLKGLSHEPATTRGADLTRMALRLPLALGREVAESARGAGATMTVLAVTT